MIEKSVYDKDIGLVKFVSSNAAQYIRISLKPFDGMRVTMPQGISVRQAMIFVEQKKGWILKAQLRIAAQEKQYTVFTPDTIFATHSRQLQMLPWKSEHFRAQLTKDSLKIFYPQNTDFMSDNIQKTIRSYINQAIREEAREYLRPRTEQLAAEHHFIYNGLTVKNLTSRWGSCSVTNHINLNMHLTRLPHYLSDYVILHELVHTLHKNHGARFWQCLNEHTENKAKQLASEMKKYHTAYF